MDSLDEVTPISRKGVKGNFFSHVFNFDDDTKEEVLNIVQYTALAIIPVVLFNKAMQRFVPEADEEKGSFELLAEVLFQVIFLFLGMMMIHRLITFVPTYSGSKYAEFSVTNIVLAVLVIVLSLQTKLGEKVSILFDRISELWGGSPDGKDAKGKKNSAQQQKQKQQQPQQQQQQSPQSLAMMSPPSTTSISQLPTTSQMPDYNTQNATSSPMNQFESFEPMAANAALGGSAFGGANW